MYQVYYTHVLSNDHAVKYYKPKDLPNYKEDFICVHSISKIEDKEVKYKVSGRICLLGYKTASDSVNRGFYDVVNSCFYKESSDIYKDAKIYPVDDVFFIKDKPKKLNITKIC